MENTKIKLGICGYGNLGKGVEKAIAKCYDMELEGIFTRRNPAEVARQTLTPVFTLEELNKEWTRKSIDVHIMCGGTAID